MQKGVVRKRRRGQISEYGRQLAEKQELKNQYNLRERQFGKYVKDALSKKQEEGASSDFLLQALESRLDSTVFRMGLAQTRKQARQMVSHGHLLVNGKSVDIPSFHVKIGDVVSVHASSVKTTLFEHAKLALKSYEAPSWLQLDKEKMEATVKAKPILEEIAPTVELPLVFEFYSR